jgi:predicted N-acetyltransferase YhbS
VTRVEIRPAVAADDHAIGELLVAAFVERYAAKLPEVVVGERRRADLRAVAAKRAIAEVWVADRGGELVGTVALWPPGAPGSEAWLGGAADLRHLAVAATVRGQGVAAALLDAAEARAWQLDASAVCLHVRRGAVGVRAVYTRRGYVAAPEGDLDARPEVYLEALILRGGRKA